MGGIVLSNTAILIIVIIAVILLAWQITNNALLLTAVQNGDSSGFLDGVRGLTGLNLAFYCVSLATVVIGSGAYIYREYRNGGLKQSLSMIEKPFSNAESMLFSTTPVTTSTGQVIPSGPPPSNDFGTPDS